MMPPRGLRTFVPPFGRTVAEGERRALPDLFLKDRHLNEKVLEPQRRLIIGRRGSGKTALAQYLSFQTDRPFDIYVNLDQRDVFASTMDRVGKMMANPPFVIERVAQVWDAVLWTALMAKVLHSGAPASCATAVRKYLRVLNADLRDPHHWMSPLLASVATRQVHELVNVPAFAEAKQQMLQYLGTERTAVIVIDALEPYDVQDPVVQRAMGVLVHAVTAFALEESQIAVKCFLPAEIMLRITKADALPNPGKALPGKLELTWSAEEIRKLICWRYATFLATHYPESENSINVINWSGPIEVRERAWNLCFPIRVKNEDSFRYIVRHTQQTPRQLIWMCNAIAEAAFDRAPLQHDQLPRFSVEDVLSGVSTVVGDLADEVLSSYSTVYPKARQIFDCLDGERTVLPMASHVIRLIRMKRAGLSYIDEHSDSALLDMATHIGILGRVTRDYDGGFDVEFEYSTGRPLDLKPDEPCAVHPMFHGLFRMQVDDTIVRPVP